MNKSLLKMLIADSFKQARWLSFPQLDSILHSHGVQKGEETLFLSNKNVVLWSGYSKMTKEALQELLEEGTLMIQEASLALYQLDGIPLVSNFVTILPDQPLKQPAILLCVLRYQEMKKPAPLSFTPYQQAVFCIKEKK